MFFSRFPISKREPTSEQSWQLGLWWHCLGRRGQFCRNKQFKYRTALLWGPSFLQTRLSSFGLTPLCVLFLQVYHLASVRLRDLCLKLDVSNDLRRKIWTCFEFTLVHCADLMKDRHLDQLLLCAFYIMAKVICSFKKFKEFYVNLKCKLWSQFTIWLLYSCHITGGKEKEKPFQEVKSQYTFSFFCIILKVPTNQPVS